MNKEKKGIIIIISCCLLLFTMFLIQLPNEEQSIQSTSTTIDIINPSMLYNDSIYSTNYNTSVSYIFINSTYASGGKSSSYIPILNVSYSPVNETFYVAGGGAGGYAHMITK